jgi:hypothetical protein
MSGSDQTMGVRLHKPAAKFYRAIQHVQKASDQYYAGAGEQVDPIFALEDSAICHALSSQRSTRILDRSRS